LGQTSRAAIFGRRRLPGQWRPPLVADERVVAWSDSDAGVLVATNLGLWLPAEPPGRLGWHEVHKAVWTGADLVVTAARPVGERDGYTVVEDLPSVVFRLREPGELPHQVRARVTRSVGYSAHHPLPGAGGLRVVARRVAGLDGLRWTVRYDTGVDLTDPVVAEVTSQILAQARLMG
jgi:hypothetical protein